MDDHTLAFIEFAKALECYLNCTILPILKLIDPAYGMKGKKSLLSKDRLMPGEFEHILSYSYRFDTFI